MHMEQPPGRRARTVPDTCVLPLVPGALLPTQGLRMFLLLRCFPAIHSPHAFMGLTCCVYHLPPLADLPAS